MKNTNLKAGVTTLFAVLILTVIAITVSAQKTEDLDQNTRPTEESAAVMRRAEGNLAGTWDVQVSLRNCQTGASMRTFASVTTFMAGGTMIDSTSGIPQALKTPGQGVWSHIRGNTYRFKFKSFNFDPAGSFTGWTIIRHEVQLDRPANEASSAGTADVYAPNGVLVFSGCSTTTAVRFE